MCTCYATVIGTFTQLNHEKFSAKLSFVSLTQYQIICRCLNKRIELS